MGFAIRLIFLFFVIAVVGVAATLALTGLEKRPLVTRSGSLSLQDLTSAETLARRYDPRFMPAGKITTVQASAAELNTLLKGSLAGIRPVAGRIEVARFGILAGVTIETPLPENPLGRFVNLRATIAPSRTGLVVSRLALGSLEIPPAVALPAVRIALEHFVGAGTGTPILDSIRSVRVKPPVVTVAFRPPPRLVEDIRVAARRQMKISDPQIVKAYYEKIDRTYAGTRGHGAVSFAEFVRPVFALAKLRSGNGDPVDENEAAIIALAIYFGDGRFERLVGSVLTATQKLRPPIGHVRLDGRHDLVRHFTVSMGLALTGGAAAATIIGEIKEANDSGRTSGFSFTDIGADRTGVRFAREAVASASQARHFQTVLSGASGERVFFPRFRDLPEGMTQARFRSRYGDVNSAAYRQVIAEIDRRIAATPLFR